MELTVDTESQEQNNKSDKYNRQLLSYTNTSVCRSWVHSLFVIFPVFNFLMTTCHFNDFTQEQVT